MHQRKIGLISLILKRGFYPVPSYLTTEPVYVTVILLFGIIFPLS
jgi:hypothetical protein